MKMFEKLLLGSAEINRMLAGINQITRSSIGLLPTIDLQTPVYVESGADHFWYLHRVLRIRKGEESQSRWAVEFWKKGGYDQTDRLIFSTVPLTHREPALEDVADTYNALEDLVVYLMTELPNRSKLVPLLLAAAEAAAVK